MEQIEQQNLDFVNIIEEGEIDRLNGLIRVSVSTNSSKRDALKKMEEQKLSNLPVVNEAGQFIGIVERTKLISSILVSLITQP
ncbi:CBS domain containing protein [Nitrosococcus halophilus Nc 4]|uniref:CBS domain containing protein n=1 Tax=Nitrosococcus halophilus (strain Nc4) TaxID=472759 RepID=D5BVY1_NITHN|nr:CBS domain-containing protein [Nitrosococcus halophilus]ADE15560.1 CBS domain containing protein [Nitrosococcus halophilus Nc 4]